MKTIAYSESVFAIAQHVSFHSHTLPQGGPNFDGSWQTLTIWPTIEYNAAPESAVRSSIC